MGSRSAYGFDRAALLPRSTYFCTFPVAVLGSSGTFVTSRGTLKCAMLLRANKRSSSADAENDKGVRGLAPFLVGHSDDGGFLHGRVTQEDSLDFGR